MSSGLDAFSVFSRAAFFIYENWHTGYPADVPAASACTLCIEVLVSVAAFIAYVYVVRLSEQKWEWHNIKTISLSLETKKGMLFAWKL